MEAPLNPYIESANSGENGPTRQPLVMTSEEMTIAVLILCAAVVIVSCLCIMAKLDWAKLSGRKKRKKSILIKKAAKKLEAEGRLKNADQAVRTAIKATAKKPNMPLKKEVKLPNGTEAQPKVIKTEDGKPVVWASRFEEDGKTEKAKQGGGDTKPSKPGDPPPKKVIKDETGREVPWKPKMQDNKPLMIFELSENPNAAPLEKFPWDTTPATANPNNRARAVNNVPAKARRFSKGDHTSVTSEKEFGANQLSSKLIKKIVRADSVDSVDEFFEARRPSDVSLDMSLVMDDTTNQPVFVFDSLPNNLRLS